MIQCVVFSCSSGYKSISKSPTPGAKCSIEEKRLYTLNRMTHILGEKKGRSAVRLNSPKKALNVLNIKSRVNRFDRGHNIQESRSGN